MIKRISSPVLAFTWWLASPPHDDDIHHVAMSPLHYPTLSRFVCNRTTFKLLETSGAVAQKANGTYKQVLGVDDVIDEDADDIIQLMLQKEFLKIKAEEGGNIDFDNPFSF